MSDIILCISAGRSDLQVLVNTDRNGNSGCYRAEVNGRGKNTRNFHEWILREKDKVYVSKEESPNQGKKANDIICDAEGQITEPERLSLTQDGKVQLEPAKIRPIVQSLQKDSNVTVKGIIVLNTHRQSDSHWAENEPIAVGPILAKWLAEVFGLEYNAQENKTGIGISGWINILDGYMEESGDPGTADYPLNREMVRRIDEHLRNIHDEWKKTAQKPLKAYLAVDGGLRSSKSLLKSIASFHFSRSHVRELHVPKNQQEISWLPVPIITPEDSFLAREHAIALIRQGDFAGAYGAVKHLDDSSNLPEKAWVGKVADVSAYFGGQLQYREDLPDYLKDFAKSESPRCLLVAMRTEAALINRRIADAISLTCTFFDAAILDAIQQHYPEVEVINEIKNQMIFSPTDYNVEQKLLKGDKPCLDVAKFREKGHYRYSLLGNCLGIWLKVMTEREKGSITYLKKYNDSLGQSIFIKEYKKPIAPRNLRNVNTHSLLKPGQLEIAEEVFVETGLWANQNTDTKPVTGGCFLAQPLVKNVLEELGQTNVSQRYTKLIEEICRELTINGNPPAEFYFDPTYVQVTIRQAI